MIPEALLRTILWLALGSWVGAWGFFAFVVSRIAFQVLPGNVAGDLAGDLLSVLHLGGLAAALIVAAASFGLGRRGAIVGLPIALAGVCLASELWISPEVAAVRPSELGAESTIEAAQRFAFLHRLSLGLFLAVHVASITLVGWHARLDAELNRSNAGGAHSHR